MERCVPDGGNMEGRGGEGREASRDRKYGQNNPLLTEEQGNMHPTVWSVESTVRRGPSVPVDYGIATT